MIKNPLKRPAGPNIRKRAMLTLRKIKLMKILNTGKIVRKGVERKISELEIEKYGFLLERCECEIASIRQRVVKA
jgi:hypothetical protein